MTAEAAVALGHNKPPSDAEILREALETRNRDLVRRRDELLAACARSPAEVGDDETAGRVTDFIKQIAAAIKAVEGTRIAEKEPHLEASRTVDGFFKKLSDPLAAAKKIIEARLTDYLRKKESEERKRREETERIARDQAEAARKAAEEAAENLQSEAQLPGAVAAEEAARAAAAFAAQAMKATEARPADLSRTRGDFGGVASLRREWTFENLDRATLDLETLRQHIPTDALEKAVRSFIRAGGRELNGVRIYEHTTGIVR